MCIRDSNIAFHIVNARQDPQAGYDAMRAAPLIGELSNIVTYSMHCPVRTESIHLSLIHISVPQRRTAAYRATLEEDAELLKIFERTYGPIKRDPLAEMCIRDRG